MTIHDRYLVDVRDLRLMRFECKAKGCGVAVSYETAKLTKVPTQCPGCGVQWHVGQSEPYEMLSRLALGLRNAIAIADEDTTGYRLRFEVERPK